ncbi:MAG TPA: hypothetical protein VNL71_15735 [Chloroflexota bacterium]|nr:hypothetical protein [Chloroflexota bacterium]
MAAEFLTSYDDTPLHAADPDNPLPWEVPAPLDEETLADLASLSRRLDRAHAWLGQGIGQSLNLRLTDGQDR